MRGKAHKQARPYNIKRLNVMMNRVQKVGWQELDNAVLYRTMT